MNAVVGECNLFTQLQKGFKQIDKQQVTIKSRFRKDIGITDQLLMIGIKVFYRRPLLKVRNGREQNRLRPEFIDRIQKTLKTITKSASTNHSFLIFDSSISDKDNRRLRLCKLLDQMSIGVRRGGNVSSRFTQDGIPRPGHVADWHLVVREARGNCVLG